MQLCWRRFKRETAISPINLVAYASIIQVCYRFKRGTAVNATTFACILCSFVV